MELEGCNVNEEFKKYLAKSNNKDKSELSPYHQIFANMREAASSIYDQYLSDKVNFNVLTYIHFVSSGFVNRFFFFE